MARLRHDFSVDDLDLERGRRAYDLTSFRPKERAESDRMSYYLDMLEVEKRCRAVADTPERMEAAMDEIERYRQKYIQHRNAVWDASSRTASPMITGPAKFPVARNNKRLDAYDKKVDAFLSWKHKGLIAALRNIERVGKPKPAVDDREPIVETVDGVEIVQNFPENRVQILFGGKPDEETRKRLKSSAWRWSPTNSAWQRKLTPAAVNSAKYCITGGHAQ
jgi:hypothetical protein